MLHAKVVVFSGLVQVGATAERMKTTETKLSGSAPSTLFGAK